MDPSADRTGIDGRTGSKRRNRSEAGGRGHDRQVLVVGDDPASVAAAGFLEQAGLDPVLASPPSEPIQPDILTLWRPGLVLLERLGLRRPVEDVGTRLDRLDCPSAGSSWTAESGESPSLIAVRRADLKRLLERRIRGRVRTADRALAEIETTKDCVDVAFEGDVVESFDAVVTTDTALVPDLDSERGAAAVHAWRFEWPPETEAPNDPTERWSDDRAAFSVPVEGDTYVRLVSATNPTRPATHTDALEHHFVQLFDSSVDPFGGLSQHAIRYHQFPRVVPVSVHADGVVLIGSTTRGSLPGDCLRATLGIEDAWVLADELAYGSRDRDDALDAYERRRRRRERDLRRESVTDAATARVPDSFSPLLSQLSASRALAFQHVTGDRRPDTTEAILESL